jgi:hypothetical protein
VCNTCSAGKWTGGTVTGWTECVAIPTPFPTQAPTKAPTKTPTAAPTDAPTLSSQDQLEIRPIDDPNFINNYASSFVPVTGPEIVAQSLGGGNDYKFTNLPAEVIGATMWKANNDIHSQPGAAYDRAAGFKFQVSRAATVYYAVARGSICCGSNSNPDVTCPATPGSCYKAQTVDGTTTTGIPCYYKNSCAGSTFPCQESAFECVPPGFTFVQDINKVVSGSDAHWLLFKKDFAAGATVGFSADSRHDHLEMGLFVKATGSADESNAGTLAPTKAPIFHVQHDIHFRATWETPTHLCAGGVCAWSTCADWKAESCPLPCADVTIRTEVRVQVKTTATEIAVSAGGGNLQIGAGAELVMQPSTAGCCAHLGANYVQDDASGKCAVSTGYPTPHPTPPTPSPAKAPTAVQTKAPTKAPTTSWVASGETVVTWKDVAAGLDASGGAIRNEVARAGVWAGAVSNQQLTYSTQAQGVSFKCSGGTDFMAGLGNPSTGASGAAGTAYESIGFGVYCTGGTRANGPANGGSGKISLFESGSRIYLRDAAGKADGRPGWTYTDTFQVQVAGNEVTYRKNGVPFYTSTTAATFPLQVDTSFSNIDGAISEVAVY